MEGPPADFLLVLSPSKSLCSASRGILVIPAQAEGGREAVTRVGSRWPGVPTVLRSLALSHFLKEVQCSCQEFLALGLQSLLLNVRPEECKKAGTVWFQSCLQGQEDLRLRLI